MASRRKRDIGGGTAMASERVLTKRYLFKHVGQRLGIGCGNKDHRRADSRHFVRVWQVGNQQRLVQQLCLSDA